MYCPYCSATDTKVVDSRLVAEGSQIRRRRLCERCRERFTTFETMELVMPRILKASGKIEPFDVAKLRRSISLPLQKRPVSLDEIDTMISRIEKTLRQSPERAISSRHLGEVVLGELKQLDDVAYVRFASVYRDFQDIEAFVNELAQLKKDDPDGE